MDGLRDKVTIVTGGATLIGAEVVRAFHGAGTKVVIAETDLADDKQIAGCVEKTVKAFGGVDFLVNLACVYMDNALASTREEWLASYNVNVVGGVVMLKAVRPHMVKRGGGVVVNFGSVSAKVAQTGR